jgi:hypothetical protein
MLYGPADLACLHRFTAVHGVHGADSGDGGNGAGNASANHSTGDAGPDSPPKTPADAAPCDVLLLPDWVFQSDLWPISRGVHAICLAYGAGSEGLMSAYGSLKSLIARFGKPEELLLLPFGCNEQEQDWVHERLVDMCRRFLEFEPRLPREKPDLHVHTSKLMPIDGGSEGVKQLFEATGVPRLSIVPRRAEAQERQTDHGGEPRRPAMPQELLPDSDVSAEVTPLVPIKDLPRDGEAVLRALVESLQAEAGGFFDIWSRGGVAATIVGRRGLIGAAGQIGDLLGFALWLCRQAKVNELDDLTSITIAARQPDSWLIEAGHAMPVPIHWVTWRVYQLGGQLGLCFERGNG